jgi:hypothetical protein
VKKEGGGRESEEKGEEIREVEIGKEERKKITRK